MKRRIFISYSRKDASLVDSLCDVLQAQGMDLFVDRTGIHGAEDFVNRIAQEISQADLVLFIASRNSYESRYVKKELIYAMDKGIPVLPYLVDDSPLPDSVAFLLGDINQVSMSAMPIDAELAQEVYLASLGKGAHCVIEKESSKPNSKKAIKGIVILSCCILVLSFSVLFARYIAGGKSTDNKEEIMSEQIILHAREAFQRVDSLQSLGHPETTAKEEIRLLKKMQQEIQEFDNTLKLESSPQELPQSIIIISDQIQERLDSMNSVWLEQARIALTLYKKTHIEQEHRFAREYIQLAGIIKKDKEWEGLYERL